MKLFVHNSFKDPFEAYIAFHRNDKVPTDYAEIEDRLYIFPKTDRDIRAFIDEFYVVDKNYKFPI